MSHSTFQILTKMSENYFYCILFYFSDIDECATNPCANKIRCIDHVNDYECICLAGYVGKNCSTGTVYSFKL